MTPDLAPPAATAARRPPRPAAVVAVLSLAVFMSGLDTFIVNLAFPSITRSFGGTGLGSLSWVLNGYTIVFAAILVPAGRWADRIGRRRVLVAGLVVFALGSAACGVAPGVGVLVAARVVQAVGAGLMVPASLSLLLATVPAAGRPRAIGTWSAAGALGAALGPVIGGALVGIGWRWVFWVNLPVAVVAVVLSQRLVPDSRDPEAGHRPDLLGAALLAGGVGLLAYGLVEAPTWGWASVGFLGSLAASAALLVAAVVRSAAHRAPVIELDLLRVRQFSGAFGASVLYYAAFGAFLLNSVEFLTGVWHYSPVRAGLAIAPGPLMVLPFARLVAPRLAGAIGGPGRVAAIGCAVNAAAQGLWYAEMQVHPGYVGHLLPAQLLGGAGVGLAIPSLLAAGSAALPPARFGAGSGVLNMARQIGTVLGVAGLVAILTSSAGAGGPLGVYRTGLLLIIGFFAAAGITAAVVLARPARRQVGDPNPEAPDGGPADGPAVAAAAVSP